MIIILLLISIGIGYEVTSTKEPVQLKRQLKQYEKDHGNK